MVDLAAPWNLTNHTCPKPITMIASLDKMKQTSSTIPEKNYQQAIEDLQARPKTNLDTCPMKVSVKRGCDLRQQTHHLPQIKP